MSELKAYIAPTADGTGLADYYLKYEADKVIALLKDKANYNECAYKLKSEELADTCRFYEDELRHNKYKRCLTMAYVEWLKQVIIGLHPESILYRKAFKRERKWRELAEKFKEAR